MTIQWLAKRVVPDFPVKIYYHPKDKKEDIVEEKPAGDMASSSDRFYQRRVQDFTFYHKFLRIDI